MTEHCVVIGAGQAAIAFAAKLRELDGQCRITLVGDESSLPYQRPPLSKAYMTGEMTADRLLLRPPAWYDEHAVQCLTGRSVEEIDLKEARLRLDQGDSLAYDRLLVATGAEPRRLPAPLGGDLPGVFVLRDLADADAIAEHLKPESRLLVVGGGYIGLEAAAVAAKLGLKVRLVENAPRILGRVAAPQTADHFRDLHRSHGVEICEGVSLERLEAKAGQGVIARFADGTDMDCDIVLVGIGVGPRTALAEQAGLAIDNGIATDETTQCSTAGIHAAGDCASFPYKDRRIRLESVQNAIDQAEAAARSVAGETVHYAPVPWFWSDQYDCKLQIAGLNQGYDRTLIRPGSREGSHSVWYFAGEEFLAVDAMNDPRAYMFGKKLLEAGVSIAPDQAADPQFDLRQLL